MIRRAILYDPAKGLDNIVYPDHGKTVDNATGTISATTTIINAVATKRIKPFAITLTTPSTTAVTITFKDGAGGTAKWSCVLQAISGSVSGVSASIEIPSYLFGTTAGNALEMALSVAVNVTYAISYWDSDSV